MSVCQLPQTISAIVAASGAFPGAFPAWPIERHIEINDELRKFWAPELNIPQFAVETLYLLAGGGIADNQGVGLLLAASRLASKPEDAAAKPPIKLLDKIKRNFAVDAVVVSDGSALPAAGVPTALVGELARAVDVVYLGTGSEAFLARESTDPPLIVLTALAFLGSRNPSLIARKVASIGLPYKCEPASRGCVAYKDLDVDDLRFIVSQMPTSWKTCASQALDALSARKESDYLASQDCTQLRSERMQQGLKRRFLLGPFDTDWDRAAEAIIYGRPDPLTTQFESMADRYLYDAVRWEFDTRLGAFAATSTLQDHIEEAIARSIQLLGRYSVRLGKHPLLCATRQRSKDCGRSSS
jgi:hypothetical protein